MYKRVILDTLILNAKQFTNDYLSITRATNKIGTLSFKINFYNTLGNFNNLLFYLQYKIC